MSSPIIYMDAVVLNRALKNCALQCCSIDKYANWMTIGVPWILLVSDAALCLGRRSWCCLSVMREVATTKSRIAVSPDLVLVARLLNAALLVWDLLMYWSLWFVSESLISFCISTTSYPTFASCDKHDHEIENILLLLIEVILRDQCIIFYF